MNRELRIMITGWLFFFNHSDTRR